MKTIHAYGGSANLYNTGNGWSWEFRSRRTNKPPRLCGNFYIGNVNTHGFGHSSKLAEARRIIVNMLKAAAR